MLLAILPDDSWDSFSEVLTAQMESKAPRFHESMSKLWKQIRHENYNQAWPKIFKHVEILQTYECLWSTMVELSKVSRGELKFSEVFKSPFIDTSTYYSTNRNYLRKRQCNVWTTKVGIRVRANSQ